MNLKWTRSALFIPFFIVVSIIPLRAGPVQNRDNNGSRGTPVTPENLKAFFDTNIPELMKKHHVVGTVAAVGNRGGTLFLKGYGKADLDKGLAVDPERTLFRPGSISKLFTWTAIMQLSEQGKLNLNDPVEKYIDFKLRQSHYPPIRIVDLMNHAPGFEDILIGLFVKDPSLKKSLRESLVSRIPLRVRPPGKFVAYSNYGTMIAGYIVERVSGMPFEDYVKKNILQPLQMNSSTFIQPLPPELAGRMSRGYSYNGNNFKEEAFEIVQGSPAGGLSATGADMLRFFRAQLNGGTLSNGTILQAGTAMEMRASTFRQDPRGNGFAHGFMELRRGKHPILGHGGDTIYFHSLGGFYPEDDLAFFVSANTNTGMLLVLDIITRFQKEFLPVEIRPMRPFENPAEKRVYEGIYSVNRRSESDPTKLVSMFMTVEVKSTDRDGLMITGFPDRTPRFYAHVDKDMFQEEGDGSIVLFLRNDAGILESLILNDFPVFLFNRRPWFESMWLNAGMALGALLLLLVGIVAPPTGFLTLLRKNRPGSGYESVASWASAIYIMIHLAAFLYLGLRVGNDFIFQPFDGTNVILFWIALPFSGLLLVLIPYLWKHHSGGLLRRIYFSLFTIFQLALFAQYA